MSNESIVSDKGSGQRIAIQKIAEWEKLKTLVLDSASSPITKRGYDSALDHRTEARNK